MVCLTDVKTIDDARFCRHSLRTECDVLEDQISETIETTGSKVKTTVGVVASAVHSVSNALDVRRQFDRNPWWWLGGALARGYIAGGRGHRKDQDLKRS